MRGSISPLSNTPSWHGAQFKLRDNPIFKKKYESQCFNLVAVDS